MWFQSTEVGQQATLDESIRRMQAFGMNVSDQMYEAMRKGIMEPSPTRMVGSSVGDGRRCRSMVWAIMAGLVLGSSAC